MKFEKLVELLEKWDKQYEKPVAKEEAFRQISGYIFLNITPKAHHYESIDGLDKEKVVIYILTVNNYNTLRLQFHLEHVQLNKIRFSKFNAGKIFEQLYLNQLTYNVFVGPKLESESELVDLKEAKGDHHKACPETLISVAPAKKFRLPSNPSENIIKMRINTLLIQYLPLPQSINYLVLEYLIFCFDAQFEKRCTDSLEEILKHTSLFQNSKSKFLIDILDWSWEAMTKQLAFPSFKWIPGSIKWLPERNDNPQVGVSKDALIMFERILVHNFYNHADFIETYIQSNFYNNSYKMYANLVLYMELNDSETTEVTDVLRKTILNFLSLIFLIVRINPKLWQLVRKHSQKNVDEKLLLKLNNSVQREEEKENLQFMLDIDLINEQIKLLNNSLMFAPPYQTVDQIKFQSDLKKNKEERHKTKIAQLEREKRILETNLLLQGFFSSAENQKRTVHRSSYIMDDQQNQGFILALTPSEKQQLTKFCDSHRYESVDSSFPALREKVVTLFIKLKNHFAARYVSLIELKASSPEQRKLVNVALSQVDILKKEIDVSSNRNQLKSIIGKASETPLIMEKCGIFDALKHLSNDFEDNMPCVTDFSVYP